MIDDPRDLSDLLRQAAVDEQDTLLDLLAVPRLSKARAASRYRRAIKRLRQVRSRISDFEAF